MTVFHRAATLAAMALTLGGLFSASSPSLAAELDRPAITVASFNLSAPNAPIQAPVPDISEALAVETPEDFDTLAEAVAAQHGRDVADEVADDEALRCLATTIFFESKGEPLAGQLAVANVVINRARSGRFASDLCGVVTQRGQFSFVRGGELPSVDDDNRLYRTALAVAKVALADAWKSPAPDALFFNGRRAGLSGRLTKVASIGNHVFYR